MEINKQTVREAVETVGRQFKLEQWHFVLGCFSVVLTGLSLFVALASWVCPFGEQGPLCAGKEWPLGRASAPASPSETSTPPTGTPPLPEVTPTPAILQPPDPAQGLRPQVATLTGAGPGSTQDPTPSPAPNPAPAPAEIVEEARVADSLGTTVTPVSPIKDDIQEIQGADSSLLASGGGQQAEPGASGEQETSLQEFQIHVGEVIDVTTSLSPVVRARLKEPHSRPRLTSRQIAFMQREFTLLVRVDSSGRGKVESCDLPGINAYILARAAETVEGDVWHPALDETQQPVEDLVPVRFRRE